MDREATLRALGAVGSALAPLLVFEPAAPGAERDWRKWQVRSSPTALHSRRGWLREAAAPAAREPARAGQSCPSEAFLADLVLLAFSLLHRWLERGQAVSAVTLARLVADRIEERPAPVPEPPAAASALVAARRQALGGLLPPSVLVEEMVRGRPFALRAEPPLGSTLLQLASPHRGLDPAAPLAVRNSVPLQAPWFAETVGAVLGRSGELERDAGGQDGEAERRFLDRLAGGEIRGRGRHASFSIRRSETGVLCVAHDLPGPFLQEAVPGTFILWERPLVVSVRLDPGWGAVDGMTLVSQLAVYASELPGGPSCGPVSLLGAHANVDSGSHRVCMGCTFEACLRLGRADLVHILLESKLAAAGRVLRHGWKHSNRQTPYHHYGRILAECAEQGKLPPYVLLDRPQAEAYVRTHAGVEIVEYDR